MSSIDDAPTKKKRRLCKESADNIKPALESKKLKHNPKFRLKPAGEFASLSTSSDDRVPLVLTDIQHLLLHSLLGNLNLTQSPRWYVLEKCHKIKQTTCLIIEGISIKHWENNSETLANIKKTFTSFVEIVTPSIYNGSLIQELALVPLSESEKDNIIQKYGSMNLALEARKDLMVMMKAVFPIVNDQARESTNNLSSDSFPRTQLILSAWQLIEENYPVPLKGKLQAAYSDYIMTKDEYSPVTENSPMFGLDCEMCLTSAGSELTRVSVVNEEHKVVYETFVKPYNNITDYLTRYSGITKSILNDVTKRLEDVQKDLRDLLPPDAILVGQSLNTDLHALKMIHPYIIDTSLIYNFTGERIRKPKLKALAREYLNEDIQNGKNGHCSVEDAIASLKLVQLKLSKCLEFGDAVHNNRHQYKENLKQNKIKVVDHYALSIFNHVMGQKKSSLIVGCDDITGDYYTYLAQAKERMYSDLKKVKSKKVKLTTVDTVDEVITSLTKASSEYNFTMGHVKLAINNENEIEQVNTINKWIQTVWSNIEESTLCVILFSGVSKDNGLAMIRIKNNGI